MIKRLQNNMPFIKRRSFTLQNRLIFSYLIVIIVPFILVGLLSYRVIDSAINGGINSSIRQTIKQTARNITYDMSRAKEISDIIYINPVIQNILSIDAPIFSTSYQQVVIDAQKVLDNLTSYRKVYNATLYYNDVGQFPFEYTGLEFQSDKKLKDTPEFKEIKNSGKGICWTAFKYNTHAGNENTYITMMREVKSLDTGKYSGVLTVYYKVEYIWDILKNITIGKTGHLFIVDRRGRVISHHNKELILTNISGSAYGLEILNNASGSFFRNVDGTQYFFVFETIEGTDWRLVGTVKAGELRGDINKVIITIVVVSMLCILLAFTFSIHISTGITRRVKKLLKAMKAIENGDFDGEIAMGKPLDEISDLYGGFNNMKQRIKKLIDQINLTNHKKRLAELKALHQQINPHFLYNTLDSINWMAASKYKAFDISLMVTSLANLFRLSLNKSMEITTVKNELEHVKSYVEIQKIRYGNQFDILFNVDPRLLENKTIKLILQPLVENSIIHGFKDIAYKGEIRINVLTGDDTLVFEVVDNGMGCDVEILNAEICKSDESEDTNSGYGIRNVNERVKLHFGKEYGIYFKANAHQGITATIKVPMV